LRVGDTVKIAHVDQSRDSLPNQATIWEAISGGEEIMRLPGREVNSRAYCAQFGFTGADQQRKGRFEIADHGTLFIDEISEISAPIQTKLLRVLQDRQFERVGGNETVTVDARVIAATNRRLDLMTARGLFREDLFYRLKVIQLEVPPLRDRREDIPVLVDAFIHEFNKEHGRKVTGVTRGVVDRMMEYEWPGNVRELRNTIDYVIAASPDDTVEPYDLPERLGGTGAVIAEPVDVAPPEPRGTFRPLADEIRELERRRMLEALAAADGVKTRAAQLIEMPIRTFTLKLKQYKL